MHRFDQGLLPGHWHAEKLVPCSYYRKPYVHGDVAGMTKVTIGARDHVDVRQQLNGKCDVVLRVTTVCAARFTLALFEVSVP